MIKNVIVILILAALASAAQDRCEQSENICSNRAKYAVGETMNLGDQMVEHDICYGDYPTETFRFVDVNGSENGSYYQVTMVRMNASW